MRLVRIVGQAGATVLGLYALTVLAVWGTACIVDLRIGEDLDAEDAS